MLYEEKDYILRLIHQMVRMLIRMLFGKDIDFREEEQIPAEIRVPVKKFCAMVEDGDINEGENQLLEYINVKNPHHFLLALAFYEKLNEQEDEFLEKHRFSRLEVLDGIKYIVNAYGYGDLADAFVE